MRIFKIIILLLSVCGGIAFAIARAKQIPNLRTLTNVNVYPLKVNLDESIHTKHSYATTIECKDNINVQIQTSFQEGHKILNLVSFYYGDENWNTTAVGTYFILPGKLLKFDIPLPVDIKETLRPCKYYNYSKKRLEYIQPFDIKDSIINGEIVSFLILE